MSRTREKFDPAIHLSQAELDQIRGIDCPCKHPGVISYAGLRDAFLEAIRQRDEAIQQRNEARDELAALRGQIEASQTQR